jgi:formylmethanofuran dehydrogenase subunit D
MKEEKMKELSRRKFLRGAGASVAGLAAVGGVGFIANRVISPGEASAAAPPFKYVKLDPNKAAEMAFDAYMNHGG